MGDQIQQILSDLLFIATHEQGIFQRVLGDLVQFGHVLGHDFDFFGAGDDFAIVAMPFGQLGHCHDFNPSVANEILGVIAFNAAGGGVARAPIFAV